MDGPMIVVILVIVGVIVLPKVIEYMKENKKNKNINFNEFDVIDKIKQQEEKDEEQMQIELEVLKEVRSEAYREQRAGTISSSEADRRVKEAKRHLKNFRILDSVEVEGKKIHEDVTISALQENGNNFDTELFKKWSKEIFKCIKAGTEELKIVKNFLTEEMYARLVYQIEQFEDDGLDFVTEDLIIEECKIFDYAKGLSKEEIKIFIKAKMREYILKKSTNEVIRGNPKIFNEKKFVMTFLKQNIEQEEGLVIKNCPNCGAENTQVEFGKCRYCSTLIFPVRYNWTLSKFETM